MKYILSFILTGFSFCLFSQNYFQWEQPTENGDVKHLLLTQEGVEKLLLPVAVGDLLELSREILSIKGVSLQLLEENESLKKELQDISIRLEKLEKEKTEISVDTTIKSINTEQQFLIDNAKDANYIAYRYYKNSNSRNGYSTVEVGQMFNVSISGTEIQIAQRIYEEILKLRG